MLHPGGIETNRRGGRWDYKRSDSDRKVPDRTRHQLITAGRGKTLSPQQLKNVTGHFLWQPGSGTAPKKPYRRLDTATNNQLGLVLD